MQQKRGQFSLEIVHCDGFTSMPATAQALYLQILSVCDDEGFTSQLGICKFLSHSTDDDVQMLVDREFIFLVGERKVCVVKHWIMNTWLRKKNISTFTERSLIYIKPNGNYTLDSNAGKALAQRNNSTTTAQQRPSHSDTPRQASAQATNPIQSNPINTPSKDSVLNNTYQSNPLHTNTNTNQSKEGSNHSEVELDCDIEDLMKEMEEEEKKKNDKR